MLPTAEISACLRWLPTTMSRITDKFFSSDLIAWNLISPLFEKEWDAGSLALIAQKTRPIRMHRPRVRSALPASNHPINLFTREAFWISRILRLLETRGTKRFTGQWWDYQVDWS